ncbi:EpsG family protein [Muribaculaceae bacterium Isolate-043 (Harlan)]|nr:EpsG family protein [Muribaculaceae bacterium Isolate-043 (Harlan)]
MGIYFTIYGYLIVMSFLDLFITRHGKFQLFMYVCFSIVIFLLVSTREMGFDYEPYRTIFNNLKSLNLSDITDPKLVYVEPLYSILNICAPGGFRSVIIIMALLNIAFLFPFIYKYSPYPHFSLLLFAGMFMYSGMMGLIRQSLAISIALWAIVNRNNRRFWIYLIFAIGFHYSAIIVTAVKLFPQRFLKIKTYLKWLLAAVCSNLFFYNLFVMASALMPTVIAWKLNTYIAEEAGQNFGLNAAVVLRLITFSLALYYSNRIFNKFKTDGSYFFNIYFLSLIMYIAFGFLPQMSSRGAVYFHYFEILLAPMILYVTNKKLKPIIFFFYAFCSFVRHLDIVTTYSEWYIPYRSWLF